MKNKIAIVLLTLAMNACGVMAAQHVFADGSAGSKVVLTLGALLANALALFGHPVAGGQSQDQGK